MAQFIPPLTWFRAFESAARHLSFTKAADELNLTQSAISQHVRSLEGQFGCELFARKHRSLELTDNGRRLLPYVSNAISMLAAAAATFEVGTEKTILTIAASPSIARWCIVPNLKSFTDDNPDIAVRLITKTWPDEFSGSEQTAAKQNPQAFYMRMNEDGKTVRAMDILFPGIGEMVGGSQREERLDVLKEKMKALDIPEEELWWYLD